jgi:hypothetical protein
MLEGGEAGRVRGWGVEKFEAGRIQNNKGCRKAMSAFLSTMNYQP